MTRSSRTEPFYVLAKNLLADEPIEIAHLVVSLDGTHAKTPPGTPPAFAKSFQIGTEAFRTLNQARWGLKRAVDVKLAALERQKAAYERIDPDAVVARLGLVDTAA